MSNKQFAVIAALLSGAICIFGCFFVALLRANLPAVAPRPAGPTATPGPSPTPIIYRWEGSGDDVIYFNVPAAGPGLVNASYTGDGNFALTLYRADGKYIALLVNTIDHYQGKTTYRVSQPGQYYLQIEASGYDYKPNWVVIMAPPQ